MLIPQDVLGRIAAGEIDLVFRRWDRPAVKAGGTQRTAVGVLAVDAVDEVDPRSITDDDARRAGFASATDLLALLDRRDRAHTYRVRVHLAGADPRVALREVGDPTAAELDEVTARLARLDRASPRGPWTLAVLQVVREHPARRAGDLAVLLGRDRDSFKLDVRKLKNLGLTISLDVGYQISPRGTAVVAHLERAAARFEPSRSGSPSSARPRQTR